MGDYMRDLEPLTTKEQMAIILIMLVCVAQFCLAIVGAWCLYTHGIEVVWTTK
jgi:hypothetical protein